MPQTESFSSINHSIIPVLYPLGEETALKHEIKESSPAYSAGSVQQNYKILMLGLDSNPLFSETTEEIYPQSSVSETKNILLDATENLLADILQQTEDELQQFIDALKSISDYISAKEILYDDKEDLLSELEEIAEEYSVPNWDGYEALPIEPQALELAKKFINALPEDLPLPETAPEPDGSISLDWIWSKDRVFSLSVGKTYELSYAWIDNEDRGYGVAKFDGETVPKRVIDSIRGFMS